MKRRGVDEQYYNREADWKEADEERSDERARILPNNISGTSDSEGYWYSPQYPILFGSEQSASGMKLSSLTPRWIKRKKVLLKK